MATQYLTLIGPPAIATALSGWLRDTKLPSWLDTIIAYLVILLTALIWALFAGKLVGDLPADTVVIAAYIAALIAGPMAALHAYLTVKWPSPFLAFLDAASAYVPIEEPSARPATITPRVTLPTTPDLVQRNSLLTNDPAWKATVATPRPLDAAPPLQVPSVDLGHVDVKAASTPVVSTEQPASSGDQGPATNPMQAVQPPPPQPSNGTQPSDGSQGGQSAPPSPYGP